MSDIALFAQTACIWEATARKPGNVHRYADSADVTYLDFLLSAAAIALVLAEAPRLGVGRTVLESVRATRRVTGTNTNLGIILLLAPLAAVPEAEDLAAGVSRILRTTDVEDARLVYEAIRLAAPGGLGHVDQQDITQVPTLPLREAMSLARDRDQVAGEYATDYSAVLGHGLPELKEGLRWTGSLEGAILWCHLQLLQRFGDSLIVRKRGPAESSEAMGQAARILRAGWPADPAARRTFADFDAWLRQVGHQRNPGTTADLVTASLFAALRTGTITLPPQLPWSAGVIDA